MANKSVIELDQTPPSSDSDIVTMGDFLAVSPQVGVERDVVPMDEFMGTVPPGPLDPSSLMAPKDQLGFAKAFGLKIFERVAAHGKDIVWLGEKGISEALKGNIETPIFPAAPLKFLSSAGIDIATPVTQPITEARKEIEWSIDQTDRLTKRSNKYEQFAVDLAGGLTDLGTKLPSDIVMGGVIAKGLISKSILSGIQKILPAKVVESTLRFIPEFATGAGAKGLYQGFEDALSEGKDSLSATLAGLRKGTEDLVGATLFARGGGIRNAWISLVSLNMVGQGLLHYETWTKEGRPPSKEEMLKAGANATAYHIIFRLFPMLARFGKTPEQVASLKAYQEKLARISEDYDVKGAENTIVDIIQDPKVPLEVKQVLALTYQETTKGLGITVKPSFENDYLRILTKANDLATTLEPMRRRGDMGEEVAATERQVQSLLDEAEVIRQDYFKERANKEKLKSAVELAMEREGISLKGGQKEPGEGKTEETILGGPKVTREGLREEIKEPWQLTRKQFLEQNPKAGGKRPEIEKLSPKEVENLKTLKPDSFKVITLDRDVTVQLGDKTKSYKKGEDIYIYQDSTTGKAIVKDGDYGILPEEAVNKVEEASAKQKKHIEYLESELRAPSYKGKDYIEKIKEELAKTKAPKAGGKRPPEIDYTKDEHYKAVRKALEEGKKVPEEVLAEYPDLQTMMPKAPKEGVLKTAGLSNRIAAEAVQRGIIQDMEGRAEYATINHADQAAKAIELVRTDPELAKRIATGRAQAPGNLKNISVYNAVKVQAIQDADVTLIRDLGRSNVAREVSEAAQTLGLVEQRDPLDPVNAIQDVIKARERVVTETKRVDVVKAIKKETASIKKAMKEAAPKVSAWEAFMRSIQC